MRTAEWQEKPPTQQADDLWRKLVLRRDRHRCRACGSEAALDAAHIRRRGLRATRWLISNGLTLCRDCHAKFHSRPKEFEAFCRQQMGERQYDVLYALSWAEPERAERAVVRLSDEMLGC